MEIKELTEEQAESLRLLKHGTFSVERAVFDAFEESETLQDFLDRATDSLKEISADAIAAIKEIRYVFDEEQRVDRKKILAASTTRLNPEDYPNGFHYAMRHPDDDWDMPSTIEKNVIVNHFGDIILDTPLELLEEEDVPRFRAYKLSEEEKGDIMLMLENEGGMK